MRLPNCDRPMAIGTGWVKGHRISVAAIVVVALSLAGCGSGGEQPEPEPELDQVRVVDSGSEIVLPLDGYRYSADEYVMVQRAAWLLIGDCVRRFGAEYTAPDPSTTVEIPPFDNENERRYGLFDPEQAAATGYNAPGVQNAGEPAEQDRTGAWSPGDTELLLVRGGTFNEVTPPADVDGRPLPDGGCQAEANRLLREGTVAEPPHLNLGNELNVQSHERARADSRVEAVTGEWRECMGRAGYSYGSIWEPNQESWPEPPGEQEIAVARADVACKRETNLVGVFFTVETAYQQRLIEDNAEALAEVRAFLEAQRENAARVVTER